MPDFMLHIVETPSKRPYPDRSGSILMELSHRLYDSGPKSKSKIRSGYLGSQFGSQPGFWRQKWNGYANASNRFLVHQQIENPNMLRMKFWTSDNLVKNWSTPPSDHHNRIRLEQLCPKVVSDRQNAGRMTSKQ